ncbi:MAG: hypothetical protein HOO86_03515 [Bacteroidales bacterium]|nr:hypothetical protein [Bacteroidales bacterium]
MKLPQKGNIRSIIFPIFLLCTLISNKPYAQDTFAFASTSNNTPTEIPGKALPKFEFQGFPREYELDQITTDIAGEHILGESIAKKLYLLDGKYTSQEAVVPGNPLTKTLISKPVIYDAVKRIEKHLKRKVKKGEMTVDSAFTIMNKVLDIALNIRVTDTEKFESELSSLNDNESRVDLFINRVQLNY